MIQANTITKNRYHTENPKQLKNIKGSRGNGQN